VSSGSALAAPQDSPSALAPTATTLQRGVPTVSYENEQAEVLSVSVTSSQGTPTGTVTIAALNGSFACKATLANGTAACSPSYRWASSWAKSMLA
jgi:hypothetical protein